MDSNLTIEEAETCLAHRLRRQPWFVSTGLSRDESGRGILMLYVKKKSRAAQEVGKELKGFPVAIRQMGAVRAIA